MVSRLRVGTTDADIIADEYASLVHKSFGHSTATIQSTEIKITASDGASSDRFGFEPGPAVGCGRIVVGAHLDDDDGGASGSAYIFDLDGIQLAKITASDLTNADRFGYAVAVGCGIIVVSAPYDDDDGSSSGSAYIFDLDGTQLAKITASDAAGGDRFGWGVAVGCGRIVVGAPYDDDAGTSSGSAYIFDLEGTQLAKITASDAAGSDYFGLSVAVGSGRIVVGAPYDDDAGTTSGSAYIFDLDGNEITKITASDAAGGDYFGWGVDVGSGKIVVGALGDDDNGSGSGSAYIFDLDGTQLAKITASDGAYGDSFGRNIAVGNGKIVVGAYLNDDAGSSSGSAYIFDLDGTQLAKITASDAAANDRFGQSVNIGCGRIVVAAHLDDYGAVTDAGAAYIYKLPQNYDIHFERTLGY